MHYATGCSKPRLLLNHLALVFIATLAIGCQPRDGPPGLWIGGELVTTPITDWSFTDQFEEIYLETQTWYFIPHSVTIWCATHNGQLYLFSIYSEGDEFPKARFWNRNVVRDPRVRLKIGNQLFERKVVLVMDPSEKDAVLQAFAKKYQTVKEQSESPESDRPTFHFFSVEPR